MKITINPTKKSRLPEIDFNNIPFGRTFSDHMFIADYVDGQWQDARIEPFGDFTISPANLTLHYGQSIFEGMKASVNQEGIPCLLRPEMHVTRFNLSAQRMCMPLVPSDLFINAIKELVNLDAGWIPPAKGSALYVRPFMYATDSFLGVQVSNTYRFVVLTGPTGPYYPKPVKLWASDNFVRAVKGGVGEAKTAGNYAASLFPAKKAIEAGYDQVMWLDALENKYIQEVGTMNIFFVIGDKVITPATDGAILKGITRNSFLTILKAKGYVVEERPITIDEVIAAYKKGTLKECFGSGTAAVVSHVAEIGYKNHKIVLPSIENRPIGTMLKNMIDGLRAGTVEDTFGWIEPLMVATK